MNLTENEKLLLKVISRDEMNAVNGGKYSDISDLSTFVDVESWAYDSKMSMKSIKGILGSLVKKGMINISEYEKDLMALDFTLIGFHCLKSL